MKENLKKKRFYFRFNNKNLYKKFIFTINETFRLNEQKYIYNNLNSQIISLVVHSTTLIKNRKMSTLKFTILITSTPKIVAFFFSKFLKRCNEFFFSMKSTKKTRVDSNQRLWNWSRMALKK